MKHYKIVKKTFYSLEKDGELHEESVFILNGGFGGSNYQIKQCLMMVALQ